MHKGIDLEESRNTHLRLKLKSTKPLGFASFRVIHSKAQSGRRGSNPRPTAWKAVALPTELLPHSYCSLFFLSVSPKKTGGESRIRTYVAEAADLQSAPFDRSGISPEKKEPPIGLEPTTG